MAHESNAQKNMPDLFSILKHRELQKERRREELTVAIKVIPVAKDVLNEIVWLGPGHRESVLRHHPGQPIERKLKSLFQMLAIFERAHADIVAQLDAFHNFSLTPEMHLPIGDAKLTLIETALNKELVAYSAAAGALVEFSRRLRNKTGLPDIEAQIPAHFDKLEHSFVIALRNMICHERLPGLGWQIEYGQEEGRRTDFVLFQENLGEPEDISKDARAYVARSPKGVRLRPLVDSYAQRVYAFYAWYKDACLEAVPLALQDYRRVNMACQATSARSIYRMLLTQYLAKKIDPYQYLHKYLLPHQVEDAMKLPHRSKLQVDFIIEIADRFSACDDELRSMVYQLFAVAETD
jgi:hypothetical protein